MRDAILLNDRAAALDDQLVPVLGYFGWFLEVVLGHLPLAMLAFGSRVIQLSDDLFAAPGIHNLQNNDIRVFNSE